MTALNSHAQVAAADSHEPKVHASTHADGGTDEINVTGLTGLPTRASLALDTTDSPQFTALNIGHASDTTLARASAGNLTVEGNALYRAGGTDVALADGGTGASLVDPNADRILFWDDSAAQVTFLAPGTNLSITGTTIDASGSGGLSSGSSNPGSPSTNDLFFRTDLGMIFQYNGTRWLCVCPHYSEFAVQDSLEPASGTVANGYTELDNGTLDLWLVRIACSTTVLSTNDGTNNWTVAFFRGPSGTALGSSFSTGTTPDTAGTNTRHDVTVGALTGTTDRYMSFTNTKVSAPGNIYVIAKAVWHYVAA